MVAHFCMVAESVVPAGSAPTTVTSSFSAVSSVVPSMAALIHVTEVG